MKKILFLVVIVLIAAAYLVGYWPQRRRAESSEKNVQQLNQQLAQAQALARLCRIQSQLLSLIAQIEDKRFADAQKGSTEFFDAVRAEATRSNTADYAPSLEAILGMRDMVTAGLAKEDSAASALLRQALSKLQQAIEQQAKMI